MANLPGAPYAAYSTRKIVAAYAGNAVQVTRKSDSTTLNVGFVGTDFDVASFNTFVAGTTAFVSRWYDQSGNTRDLLPVATATVGLNEPQLIVLNGKAYLCFLSQDTVVNGAKILSPAVDFPATGSLTVVLGGVSLTNDNQSIPQCSFRASGGYFLDLNGTGNGGLGASPGQVFYFSGGTAYGPNAGVNMLSGQHNIGVTVSGTTLTFYDNGVSGTVVNGIASSTPSAPATGFGGYPADPIHFAFNGVMTEAAFYNSALTGVQMTSIAQDQAAYWPDPGFGFPYATGDTIPGVTFGVNAFPFVNGERVSLGNALQFEYTQPWTMFAAVQAVGVPMSSTTPAAIIFTNVTAGTPFPGYEVWVNGNGAIVVRIIHSSTAPQWIDMHQTVPSVCDLKTHMVAVSYDGSGVAAGVKVYVDGIAVGMTVDSDTLGGQTIVSAGQSFWIGMQQSLHFPWGGVIKRFQIDNVARSAAYIAACATPASLPPIDTNTQVCLRFQDGSGTTVVDSSGKGINGTLTNAAQWMGLSSNLPPVTTSGTQPILPSQRPLSISNLLTNEVIGFDTVSDALLGNPFFTFANYDPSLYEIRNNSGASLTVSVGRKNYTVANGQLWTFNLNPEVGPLVGWRYVSGTRVFG